MRQVVVSDGERVSTAFVVQSTFMPHTLHLTDRFSNRGWWGNGDPSATAGTTGLGPPDGARSKKESHHDANGSFKGLGPLASANPLQFGPSERVRHDEGEKVRHDERERVRHDERERVRRAERESALC